MSVLGFLLFNIYICDIFFDNFECDIASYAGDNTPYNFDFSLDDVISNLETSSNSLLRILTEKKDPKTPAFTKNANINKCVVGTSNYFFLRGSKTKTNFPKK